MVPPGTDTNPLRVAIIGAGPSGFYVAEHLFNQPGLVVEIDMLERLPTPYGLVRGGVAPDHQKIKDTARYGASRSVMKPVARSRVRHFQQRRKIDVCVAPADKDYRLAV